MGGPPRGYIEAAQEKLGAVAAATKIEPAKEGGVLVQRLLQHHRRAGLNKKYLKIFIDKPKLTDPSPSNKQEKVPKQM